MGAVGSAGTAHSAGRDPGLGAALGHRPSEHPAIAPGVSAVQQYQSCTTFPRLTCAVESSCPFKSFCHSPAEWGVLALTKQEKDRDMQPICPAVHSSVLQGHILPVLVVLCPAGSFHVLVAAGGRTVGPWTVGRQTSQTSRTLTVVSALAPAVADFRSQAPLSQDLWPHSPLRRLPHIVPAPQSVKPAGHRGSCAFLEGPLWKQTLAQAAHTGQSDEHCLGFHVPLNSPSQAGGAASMASLCLVVLLAITLQ